MCFLERVAVLAKKREDKNPQPKEKNEILLSMQKDMQARLLDQSRERLADALRRNLDRSSPNFRRALQTFRQRWVDFYKFPLKPDQEERYLEVLRDKDAL